MMILMEKSSVNDIDDAELLARAIKGARSRLYNKGVKHPRWAAVCDMFGLGSTYSAQLCERFGLNPDEMVKR